MASDTQVFIPKLFWDLHAPQSFNYLLEITKILLNWHQQLAHDTCAPGYDVSAKTISRHHLKMQFNISLSPTPKTQMHIPAVSPNASQTPAVKSCVGCKPGSEDGVGAGTSRNKLVSGNARTTNIFMVGPASVEWSHLKTARKQDSLQSQPHLDLDVLELFSYMFPKHRKLLSHLPMHTSSLLRVICTISSVGN